jgi:hypothetical protein
VVGPSVAAAPEAMRREVGWGAADMCVLCCVEAAAR